MDKRLIKQSEAMDCIAIPIAFAESCGEMGCSEICEEYIGNACKGCPVQEIFQTLAQYETSGLSPEEAQKLAKAQAEERLVELPCKVGDTVHHIEDGKVETAQVVGFYISYDGIGFENSNGYEFATAGDIGKTVFLSREEAERAVKG